MRASYQQKSLIFLGHEVNKFISVKKGYQSEKNGL